MDIEINPFDCISKAGGKKVMVGEWKIGNQAESHPNAPSIVGKLQGIRVGINPGVGKGGSDPEAQQRLTERNVIRKAENNNDQGIFYLYRE